MLGRRHRSDRMTSTDWGAGPSGGIWDWSEVFVEFLNHRCCSAGSRGVLVRRGDPAGVGRSSRWPGRTGRHPGGADGGRGHLQQLQQDGRLLPAAVLRTGLCGVEGRSHWHHYTYLSMKKTHCCSTTTERKTFREFYILKTNVSS